MGFCPEDYREPGRGARKSDAFSQIPLVAVQAEEMKAWAAKWWWEDGREQVKEELVGLGEGERLGTQAQLHDLWLRQ